MIARGEFQVDLQPIDAYAQGKAGTQFHRMSINKTFTGDLTAVSQGEMISVLTNAENQPGMWRSNR